MELLKINDLSKLFGVSRQTVDRWRRKPDFPPGIKLSRQTIAWSPEMIQDWLDTRARTSLQPIAQTERPVEA